MFVSISNTVSTSYFRIGCHCEEAHKLIIIETGPGLSGIKRELMVMAGFWAKRLDLERGNILF